jgi:dihydroorotate dehydrogenase
LADRIADYAQMTRMMAPLANYLTVNISSPNTPGLRALQDEGALAALLDAVMAARGVARRRSSSSSPDLRNQRHRCHLPHRARQATRRADRVQHDHSRPPLRSRHAGESGGLSGEPLRDLALQRLRDFRKASGGAIPLIGVGGIATVEDAWQRIRAGASLIQLYSALVYEGPGLVRRIVHGLAERARAEGMGSIAEAVGTE